LPGRACRQTDGYPTARPPTALRRSQATKELISSPYPAPRFPRPCAVCCRWWRSLLSQTGFNEGTNVSQLPNCGRGTWAGGAFAERSLYPCSMTLVAGADVSKRKWVAVILDQGHFGHAVLARTLTELRELIAEVAVLAIDIPIGLPEGDEVWPRQADRDARAMVGPRASSVFFAPPRPVFDAPDYPAASQLQRRLTGKGLSRQSWALRDKALETERFVHGTSSRVIEVHPEVSFRAMSGAPLGFSKRTWNGQHQRRKLLQDRGIVILDTLDAPAGRVPPDDLLDAAAAAWSAHRYAMGKALALPEQPPSGTNGPTPRIWY